MGQPLALVDESVRLEPAANAESFAAAPVGRYFVGSCWMVWASSPTLTGTVMWGHPGAADAQALVRAWAHLDALALGYDAVSDFSRVERVETGAFQAVWGFLAERGERYYRRLGRQALVRGSGLPGAVVEGFFGVLRPDHAWRTFGDAGDAFAWLERPDGVGVRDEIERIAGESLATPQLIRELRRLLSLHLEEGIPLPDCARELGTSERSLQRHLQESNTSFRREVDGVRLAAARSLLIESDHKLEVVSRLVGMSSVSQLSLLFRRATGMTPGEFRRRSRG